MPLNKESIRMRFHCILIIKNASFIAVVQKISPENREVGTAKVLNDIPKYSRLIFPGEAGIMFSTG